MSFPNITEQLRFNAVTSGGKAKSLDFKLEQFSSIFCLLKACPIFQQEICAFSFHERADDHFTGNRKADNTIF